MKIWKSFTFSAAHHLPNVKPGHKCGAVHGHTYTVVVELTGDVSVDAGWVRDFGDISGAVQSVLLALDHRDLNEVVANPTAENLAMWIRDRLRAKLPELSAVEVRESPTTGARWEA
jgi:6-pyruvoyltetrahydropterin/6-carboxytetrahydropterin synthase